MEEWRRRMDWDKRIRRSVAGAVMLSLVFFLMVPFVVGLFIGPIIHMSDYHIASQGGCNLIQYLTLTNSGNAAGIAVVEFFVDHRPWTNWTFTVPAHTTATKSGTAYVPDCMSHRYGVGLISVEPAYV